METEFNVDKCTSSGLKIRATSGDPTEVAEVIVSLDEYLSDFAQPNEDMKCLKCGTVQTGLAASLLGTGFQWGIQNGEGACSSCGWPGRGIHKIPNVGTLTMLLQYHPDVVK